MHPGGDVVVDHLGALLDAGGAEPLEKNVAGISVEIRIDRGEATAIARQLAVLLVVEHMGDERSGDRHAGAVVTHGVNVDVVRIAACWKGVRNDEPTVAERGHRRIGRAGIVPDQELGPDPGAGGIVALAANRGPLCQAMT